MSGSLTLSSRNSCTDGFRDRLGTQPPWPTGRSRSQGHTDPMHPHTPHGRWDASPGRWEEGEPRMR